MPHLHSKEKIVHTTASEVVESSVVEVLSLFRNLVLFGVVFQLGKLSVLSILPQILFV